MQFAAAEVAVGCVFGIVGMSFLEYMHHRFGGHTDAWGTTMRSSHTQHHSDALEGGVLLMQKFYQRAPIVCALLLTFGGPQIIVSQLLQRGVLFALGSIGGLAIGYGLTEGYHHRMHHSAPTTAFGRFIRRHHFYHHFVSSRVNFGFTSPLWDWVMGTYVPVFHVHVPRKQAARGLESCEGFSVVDSQAESLATQSVGPRPSAC